MKVAGLILIGFCVLCFVSVAVASYLVARDEDPELRAARALRREQARACEDREEEWERRQA